MRAVESGLNRLRAMTKKAATQPPPITATRPPYPRPRIT
jgi:hypothetical protein